MNFGNKLNIFLLSFCVYLATTIVALKVKDKICPEGYYYDDFVAVCYSCDLECSNPEYGYNCQVNCPEQYGNWLLNSLKTTTASKLAGIHGDLDEADMDGSNKGQTAIIVIACLIASVAVVLLVIAGARVYVAGKKRGQGQAEDMEVGGQCENDTCNTVVAVKEKQQDQQLSVLAPGTGSRLSPPGGLPPDN